MKLDSQIKNAESKHRDFKKPLQPKERLSHSKQSFVVRCFYSGLS